MRIADLVTRVDELLALGANVLATRRSTGGERFRTEYVDSAAMTGFRSASLSFVDRVYGASSPHFQQITEKADSNGVSNCEAAISILKAMRSELSGGWMFSLKGLVTAEVFADFLSMADHLLDTGYKDPAAVMTGSVLEGHLRQLCSKHGVQIDEVKDGKSVPLKADRLNAELARINAYSKLDQKLVTAWLDLRNLAAHGQYGNYSKEQVHNMLLGVTEFMARVTV